MKIRLSRTTLYIIFAAVVLLIGGFAVWQLHAPDLQKIADDTTTAQDNLSSYEQLIAKKNMFRKTYTQLASKYLSQQSSPTSIEAKFTDILANVATRDNVQFVGITYGTLNGSNPPPPDPHIDANGQPIQQPQTALAPPPTDSITNLGGRGPGDPQFGRPDIPTSLFTRIPAGVTYKGQWRNLLLAIQDISKQNVLMSVSRPEVRRLEGTNLIASFNVQLLTPAITIVPDLLDPDMMHHKQPMHPMLPKPHRLVPVGVTR
jgi:hypothetical protein